MFRHHFMIIDKDRGGSVDAGELQDLTVRVQLPFPLIVFLYIYDDITNTI